MHRDAATNSVMPTFALALTPTLSLAPTLNLAFSLSSLSLSPARALSLALTLTLRTEERSQGARASCPSSPLSFADTNVSAKRESLGPKKEPVYTP